MMRGKADLILCHASELVTVAGYSHRPKKGKELSELGLIEDGAVAVKDGRIIAVGKTATVMREIETDDQTLIIDAHDQVVLPGLVDPHTHLVFAGSREHELEMKIEGRGYLDILASGGGILDTVRSTRKASSSELYSLGKKYLKQMLAQGTTTAEVKSGYGLTTADEMKMLSVISELDDGQPVDLVPTFLGAHAIPEEFKSKPEEYVALIKNEMLPEVARGGLAEFCDVFTEEGVFSIEQSRQILTTARQLGLKLKVHADEIICLGGAELAAELAAVSADHLMMVSDEGIRQLANSKTIAVLLPATTFCLMGEQYAPARKMIEAGVAVALASDFNPGSCPVNSLQIVMGIACRQYKMKLAEVISGVTINAAHAINRAEDIGSLEVGKKADFVIFDAPTYRYLMYRFGTNLVNKVVKDGQVVVGG